MVPWNGVCCRRDGAVPIGRQAGFLACHPLFDLAPGLGSAVARPAEKGQHVLACSLVPRADAVTPEGVDRASREMGELDGPVQLFQPALVTGEHE